MIPIEIPIVFLAVIYFGVRAIIKHNAKNEIKKVENEYKPKL